MRVEVRGRKAPTVIYRKVSSLVPPGSSFPFWCVYFTESEKVVFLNMYETIEVEVSEGGSIQSDKMPDMLS